MLADNIASEKGWWPEVGEGDDCPTSVRQRQTQLVEESEVAGGLEIWVGSFEGLPTTPKAQLVGADSKVMEGGGRTTPHRMPCWSLGGGWGATGQQFGDRSGVRGRR